MSKNVIGFFCGTGYEVGGENPDASLAKIRSSITRDTTLLAYDGCQVHGGGAFAYGVEEQADAFIKDLKEQLQNHPDNEEIQLNLVAHSRGCLSALIAIKKIQADPLLNNRIKITADLRDPVPGNFQFTTNIAGNLASAKQLMDLSDCDIVKKVYITLQEKPIIPIAFDALVSMFPPKAQVEIEALPGYHDVQQRDRFAPDVDHYMLLELGNAKTLSILRADGHDLNHNVDYYSSLEDQQISAYDTLVEWAKTRQVPFGERDLHFGGKIIANNDAKAEIDVINWRHARLKGILPDHVLYGTNQPHYNYRKTILEHYCDLTQTLDKYLAKHPDQQDLVTGLKDSSKTFYAGGLTLDKYRLDCNNLLKTALVNDSNIIKAINYMCLQDYFNELDQTIATHVVHGNPLHESLQNLRHTLVVELAAEIESGKTLKQIEQSHAVKIINNTDHFIKSLYKGDLKPAQMIEAADHYANDNIRLGRNWHLGSKVIAGALLCVAAGAVGCIIGAAIGLAIGFACGAITGPGSFITAAVGAFLGGFKGAMIAAAAVGGAVGLGVGVYGANLFFKPVESDIQVQALANTVKAQEQSKLDPVIESDTHGHNEQLAF